MGFGTNSYVKVWNVEDKGNYSVVELSMSKKHKDGEFVVGVLSNGYDIQFSNRFVRFVGHAHNKIKGTERNTTIILKNIDVTNKTVREKLEFEDEEKAAITKAADITTDTLNKTIDAIGERLWHEYTNYAVFDFEFADDNANTSVSNPSTPDVITEDDKLPFEFD